MGKLRAIWCDLFHKKHELLSAWPIFPFCEILRCEYRCLVCGRKFAITVHEDDL